MDISFHFENSLPTILFHFFFKFFRVFYIPSKIYKHYLPNVPLTLPYYRDDTPGSNVLVNPRAIT